MTGYTLGIDIGTFESKGALVDPNGVIVGSAAKPHKMIVPKPGWAEHRAREDWWDDLKFLTHAILDQTGIAPKDSVAVTIKTTAEGTARLQEEAHILKRMARIDDLTIDPGAQRPDRSAIQIVGDLQIFVHDVIDDDAQERQRIEKAVGQLDKRIKGTESKLANENYVRSAPVEVVAETREILDGLKAERGTFQDILALLQ